MKKLPKSRRGFTLLELLIVITIAVVISASLAAGIITLQNITTLDTTTRDMKLEIQSVQNQARNSFVTYDRNSTSSASQNIFGTGGGASLNIGWLITFDNAIDSGSGDRFVRVTRQAIFFKPSDQYDITRLREDIIAIYNTLSTTPFSAFSCNGDQFRRGSTQVQFRSVNSSDATNYFARCADSTLQESDYFEERFDGVELTDSAPDLGGSDGLTSCWRQSATGQKSIFFTAGYGEARMNLNGTLVEDCQYVIKIPNIGADTKGIKITRDIGTVEICGRYCSRTGN